MRLRFLKKWTSPKGAFTFKKGDRAGIENWKAKELIQKGIADPDMDFIRGEVPDFEELEKQKKIIHKVKETKSSE